MTPLLLDALARRPTPRRPLWIMRQAGRYLPEYRELRKKHSFEDLSRNPDLATRVTLMPLARFPFDAAIVFADLMSPITALGVPFRFDPGPVLGAPVRTKDEIEALRVPDGEEIAPEVIETLRLVRAELPASTALLGFAGAPWSLAAYLVQGHGKSDFPALRALAAGDPALLGTLLDRLATLIIRYAIRQHDAGADAIQLFDTWAGLIARDTWERLVRPHLHRVLTELGDAGVPRILFVQNAPHLLDAFAELPSEALATDWRVNLGEVAARLNGSKAVQGNLDPAYLLAGPAATRAAAREILEHVPRDGHIMNLGHGITPDAPLASVEALVQVVHEESAP